MNTSKPRGGIVQDMTEVKEMFKLACFVDSDKYTAPTRQEVHNGREAIMDCANKYATIKRRLSRNGAHKVLDLAISEKYRYIEIIGDDVTTDYVLRLTPEGRQLIARTWLFYRYGLREQTMKHYPQTMALYRTKYAARVGLTGAIIAAALEGIVVYLVKRG